MTPAATGSITTVALSDGSRAFYLRFRAQGRRTRVILHERRGCDCGCGGGWDEPAARNELGNIVARVRAGVWKPAEPLHQAPEAMPTFHEYASAWLQAKVEGVLGDKPIDANAEADCRWRLSRHLLPFFAAHRLDEIDRELCLEFKAHKLREAAELRAALAAGAELRDRRGRRIVPLGRPRSARSSTRSRRCSTTRSRTS